MPTASSSFLVLGAVCNGILRVPAAPTPAGRNVGDRAFCPHGSSLPSTRTPFGGVVLGLYCAHVEVPVDYHNSSAGTASLKDQIYCR